MNYIVAELTMYQLEEMSFHSSQAMEHSTHLSRYAPLSGFVRLTNFNALHF